MVEFVLFPYDLYLSTVKNIFHGGVVKLGELFVALSIEDESLLEGINCSLLIVE